MVPAEAPPPPDPKPTPRWVSIAGQVLAAAVIGIASWLTGSDHGFDAGEVAVESTRPPVEWVASISRLVTELAEENAALRLRLATMEALIEAPCIDDEPPAPQPPRLMGAEEIE